MGLTDYLQVLRKFWISIVALTLLGIAAGAAASLLATPTYTSSVSLYLTVQSGDSPAELSQGSSYTERQVKSFAQIAESPIVLQPVIDELGLSVSPAALAQQVSVTVPANTSILNVAVVDTDAQRAAATASAVGDQLIETVARVSPKDGTGKASVEANMIKPATVPSSWTTPKVFQNLALGLLLGLLVGVGQALLRTVLDTRVRNADDIAQITDVPIVGTIVFDAAAARTPLAVLDDRNSLRAEEYRRLRTNIQFLDAGSQGSSIAITSSVAAEGKTSTVLNVAIALAETGKRVLLMDADLRRPRVAQRLKIEGAVGLSTILVGRATLDDVTQPVHGLDVLPAGQVPPNPSELLGSERMRALVQLAQQSYDYVLIDSAPLGPVADTAVLSSMIGGVVIVTGSGQVHAAELSDSIASVEAAEGKVLGMVLNKLRPEDSGTRRSSYYQRGAYGDDVDSDGAAPVDTPMPVTTGRRPRRVAKVASL